MMRLSVLSALFLALTALPAYAAGMLERSDAEVSGALSGHTISVPYGKMLIHEGFFAVLPSETGVLHVVFDGSATLTLDGLPDDSSLNLFYEMGLTSEGEPVTIDLSGFYSKSAGGDETWEIAPAEAGWQAALSDALWGYYVQAWSDAFPDEAGAEGTAAMHGGGSASVRSPGGDEFFMALFPSDGGRFDYRGGGDAKIVIEDYLEGFNYYEHPFFTETLEFDDSLDVLGKYVSYEFVPKSRQIRISAFLQVRAREDVDDYTLLTYPLGESDETDPFYVHNIQCRINDVEVTAERVYRQDEPTWEADIDYRFEKGKEYGIYAYWEGKDKESYDGLGYGGVYRFDDSVVYTGSDECDKLMDIKVFEPDFTFVQSPKYGSAPKGGLNIQDYCFYGAGWKNSSRSVMVVATKFPMREIESGSVTLEVYAPEDIIGLVHENPAVSQLGSMLDYYTEEFGIYSDAYPEGKITRQPVFIIPDETGVAAFENAGLLFYLGSKNYLPLIAHEVSHIWWGQMVDGPTWFVEGMANYSPIAYFEEFEPGQAESYRRYIMQAAVAQGKPMSLERRMELGDKSANYQHGAALWIMLAKIVGKERFHSALRAINERHTDAPEMTADAIFDELEKELKELSVPDFRENHFDNTSIPTVFVEATPADAGDAHKVTVTITRDPNYAGRLPVYAEIYLADGTSVPYTFETFGEETTSTIALPAEFDHIVLDPENHLLIRTPERETYQEFLGWLMPAWKKRGMGDVEGAIYHYERALEYRAWARDVVGLADLYFKVGRVGEASGLAGEILDTASAGEEYGGHEIGTETLARAHWLLGKIAELDGDEAGALSHFEKVVELASQVGLYNLVKSANEKLGIESGEEG